MSVTITKSNFENVVLQSTVPVLIDFWATWCSPCKMVTPIVDSLANELQDKAIVGKINVDEENELAMRYSVMSIPTLIVLQNGQEINRVVGVKDKDYLRNMLGV